MYQHIAKVVLCGPAQSGKSALTLYITDKRFVANYDATIGVEYASIIKEEQKQKVKLQIWDTAGSDSFASVTQSYSRGANVLIYTIDLSGDLSSQKTYLMKMHKRLESGSVPYLVGTKIDKPRTISAEDFQALAKELGVKATFECSAKEGTNIDKCVATIITNFVKDLKAKSGLDQSADEKSHEKSDRTERSKLIQKEKKPCWACLCCGWGSSSAKEDLEIDSQSEEQNDRFYSKLGLDT